VTRRAWIAVLGAWLLLALFFAAQAHAMYPVLFGRELGWGRALAINLNHYLGWALLTPLVLGLLARVPWEAARWDRFIGIHLPAAFAITALHLLFTTFTRTILVPEGQGFRALLDYSLRFNGHADLATYACLLGAGLAWEAVKAHRRSELAQSRLGERLALAELQALRMQLHPHFLFNALNGISALIPRDPEAADEMLSRLGQLLRKSLDRREAQTVPLREELAFLDDYLELERLQYADRLSVTVAVPEALLDLPVPALLLQPLVENALRHGLAPKAEGGTLRLAASRREGRLLLAVEDDGYGLPDPLQEGHGLRQVRERLRLNYGAAASFDLRPRAGGGTRAELELPLR
jgi:hypothetical protein